MRIAQIAVITITVAAISQELSKPKDKRTWHGKALGIFPYDFRIPTSDRLKEAYWNSYDRHIITPKALGIGWTINFYALFENLGLIRQPGISEENFLMPNERMKQILRP